MKRSTRALGHAALLAVAAAVLPAPQGAAAPAAVQRNTWQTYPLTLVTGHHLLVQELPGGRYAVSVAAAASETPSYQTYAHGEDLYVIPDEAAPLVPERLDRELFNVATLVRAGYHDRERDELPLLLELAPGAAPVLPGITPTDQLESIDGTAAELDKDDADDLGAALEGGVTGGVEKIWLDAPVEAALQDSVPKIRAPEAWARGYDGTGTSVAVLDTGMDATHPDLAGKIAAEANFTTAASAVDRHGHGTHVASIVAGSGAASNGSRKGVAPGAALLNGKVLGDNGIGLSSWVIAGMEWAATEHGADVVNMSLGASPTDGTDPLSQAVNSLTAQTGTLFVIAAGNGGPEARTVTSPGAADSALTVGAVDKADNLAQFSSRGPRAHDLAVKPDIIAPGVNITAARAAGTTLGTAVDARYTRASGTSMATPHVAGAAAILAQRRPAWDAEELKAGLVTSAVPRGSLTVYQQGGGRVDVAAAVDQPVTATPAPVSLGAFRWPHGDRDPIARTVTLRNVSDEVRTLTLALGVTHESGAQPETGMFAVSPAEVTIASGESAEVTVGLDTNLGQPGVYGGALTAQGDGVTVRVPVGLYKEPERYDLVVRGLDRDGVAASGFSSVQVQNVDDFRAFYEERFFNDGVVRFRLPPGTYSILGSFRMNDASGKLRRLAWVSRPEEEIAATTELVLDARDAVPIQVATPGHVTVARQVKMSQHRASVLGGSLDYTHIIGFALEVFAAPTPPVTEGAFEFFSAWRLLAPDAAGAPSTSSAFVFDLLFPEPDRVPPTLDYVADASALARIDSTFHVHEHPYRYEAEWRNSWRPHTFFTLDIGFPLDAPLGRIDYLSPGDTEWRQAACPKFFAFVEPFLCLFERTRAAHTPGERSAQTWLEQPASPTVLGAVHDAGTMFVDLSALSDAAAHPTSTGGFDQSLELVENGQVVEETSGCACMIAFVSDERREYSLHYEADAGSPAWGGLGRRARVSWTFESGREEPLVPPILEPEPPFQAQLPLLQVGYDLELDATNRAPFPSATNGPFPVTIRVARQPQAPPAAIEETRLWSSHDDGEHWSEVALERLEDGVYRGAIAHPSLAATTGTISLRVHARDAEGASVEQDLIGAYALTPPFEAAVNTGDGAYTDTLGRSWSPDRPYTAGGFGYTNISSEVRTTTRAIAGTEDDPLYRALRQNPGEYRFDGLPRGVYEVELHFAEIDNRKPGNRVFDVLAEGTTVLPGHDIAADAGATAADVHRIRVPVMDGRLELRFASRQGSAPPVVSAIRVRQTET